VVAALVDAGHDVIAPSRTSGPGETRCDFTELAQVTALIRKVRPEVLVDLVTDLGDSFRTVTLSKAYRRDLRTRRAVVTNLRKVGEAAGVSRFVTQTVCFTSAPGPGLAAETRPLLAEPPHPWQLLVRTQRLVESTALHPGGQDVAVLRLGFLWGPGTWWSADGAYTEAVRRRRFPLIGDGQGLWAWLHVDDAAAAFVRAVERGGGLINVAQQPALPIGQWLPELASAVGAPPPRHLPAAIASLAGGGVAAHTGERLPAPCTERASHILGWQSQRLWSPHEVLVA
jgi:nucleoside-diphosphate-sugar epimerase